ncbi:hypothetical protein HMPREF9336_04124 [Segniliparus rugosus ATCC BAA-974]|uniref:Uncharacterized protein n=1 Tax=Segniliparus rugosus (strain ATCC BAA-974 / DSM 45345 / CCUG 50838 / CIP 108380 / JCM 13579 / CDC 945) TaxID=679197 RepID=U1N9G2_SEGRC|nr:hypothetical protein HMPREF9336_04124 [Segniliparus rugosus ATCC BAA-974]
MKTLSAAFLAFGLCAASGPQAPIPTTKPPVKKREP